MVFPPDMHDEVAHRRDRRVVERLVVGKHQRGAVHRPLEEPRRRHIRRGVSVVVDDFHDGVPATGVALAAADDDPEVLVEAIDRVLPHRVVHDGDGNGLPVFSGGEGHRILPGDVVVRCVRTFILRMPGNGQRGLGGPVKRNSQHGLAGILGNGQETGGDGDDRAHLDRHPAGRRKRAWLVPLTISPATHAHHGELEFELARRVRRGEARRGGAGTRQDHRRAAGLGPGVGDVRAPGAAAGGGVKRHRRARPDRLVVAGHGRGDEAVRAGIAVEKERLERGESFEQVVR